MRRELRINAFVADGGQLLRDRQQRGNLGDFQALIDGQVVNVVDGAGTLSLRCADGLGKRIPCRVVIAHAFPCLSDLLVAGLRRR